MYVCVCMCVIIFKHFKLFRCRKRQVMSRPGSARRERSRRGGSATGPGLGTITVDTLWDTRCGTRVVGHALWDTRCGTRVVGHALWDTRCGTRVVGHALWDTRCGTRVVGHALWDTRCGTCFDIFQHLSTCRCRKLAPGGSRHAETCRDMSRHRTVTC